MNERFKDDSVGEAMLLARAAVGSLIPEQMRRRHEQSLLDDEAERQRQLLEDARLVCETNMTLSTIVDMIFF